MTNVEQLSACQIQLNPILLPASGELSDEIICKCAFCEKSCEITDLHTRMNKITGSDDFYCSFCLRHGHYTKNSKDILILSFRSIIGYFYGQYQNNRKFWVSEIEDYVNSHIEAGLVNPAFNYDPDTLLWFVDFRKIGNSPKKIPIEEVYKTVISILTTFNLTQIFPGCSTSATYKKYQESIENFYNKRYRPDNRRMLIPTVCGLEASDRYRNFVFEDLIYQR